MLELPKPPWYRRVWMLNLAVAVVLVVVVVAATVVLGSRNEPAAGPTTVATTSPPDAAPPPTRGTTPRTIPKAVGGVLWAKTGRDVHHGDVFEAPGVWYLLWSFDCRSFRRYGGGNFKIYGEGGFAAVSVQEFAVKGNGRRRVTHGGSGRLVVESVCDRWTVKAVAP